MTFVAVITIAERSVGIAGRFVEAVAVFDGADAPAALKARMRNPYVSEGVSPRFTYAVTPAVTESTTAKVEQPPPVQRSM